MTTLLRHWVGPVNARAVTARVKEREVMPMVEPCVHSWWRSLAAPG